MSRPIPALRSGKPAFVVLDQRTGHWWWKPPADARREFRAQKLGEARAQAWALARELNGALADWRVRQDGKAAPARPARAGAATVGQLVSAYLASADWRALAQRTREQYAYELGRLEAEFGHDVANLLSPVRVDDWADGLRLGRPETLRHVAARGRGLFAWAARKGLVRGVNPFARLNIGGGNKRARFFRWDDVQHLVGWADRIGRPSIGTALVLGFASLQRITDVYDLTWDNLPRDGAGRRLVLTQSKTGRRIDVAAPSVLLARLQAAPPPATAAGHLVVSETTGRSYGREGGGKHGDEQAAHAFRRVLSAAIADDPARWGHLRGLQLRDCRRSGFLFLYDEGQIDVPKICAISGHDIDEGYEIVEHYLPRTARRADEAMIAMKVSL